jgi:hypothetical protein
MVLLMNLPKSYEFLVTFLKSLEFNHPKKLPWEVITTKLLNEKFMRKEKVGPSKSSIETTFILAQKKSKSKGSRN